MSQTISALLSLRERILDGSYAPGERMTEISLSEALGVSRTPLRTALARLEAEGLLDALPSGGYVVRAFSARDIRDAIELRGLLEGLAARYAAERGTDAQRLSDMRGLLNAIDELLNSSRDTDQFKRYVTLNGEFHDHLAKLAGSDILERELMRVTALPFASASALVMAQAERSDSWNILLIAQHQHHAVLDAIEAREGTRAEALMREHARLARRNLRFLLDRQRVDQPPPSYVKGAALLKLVGD